MIEFDGSGGPLRGYLAKPESGTGPGVVVIQEWWGLVPHIKDVADRFAKAGFVALAPDLYRGESTTSPDDAGRMMMALEIERTEKDLRGAISALREQGGATKVGVVGFCLGGQLALLAATTSPGVDACVDFYGVHPNVKPDFEKLACPVLGLFGSKDDFVTPEAVTQLVKDVEAAGKSMEHHTYDTGHAFFNDTRPEAYDEAAAGDAWKRTIAFLQANLT